MSSRLSSAFKKLVKSGAIDLNKDTIKVQLPAAKEEVVFDANDFSIEGESIKATMAFVSTPKGTECIHFEHTGEPIIKIDRIGELASQGRWIWHSKVGRGIPAAKIQKLPFKEVLGYIRMGWLYEYVAKK